jgi:PTS system nitrogen regulatory IIA component
MRENGICTKLRANSDPATLYAILTEGRTIQAA